MQVFCLSNNEKTALLVENTGRLIRSEIDRGGQVQVFCRQPLKQVWGDNAGDLILAQDDQGAFYAFEWIGDVEQQ